MEFYRKSKYYDMFFDVSSQQITKKDLSIYLASVTNCKQSKLKKLSWNKLFALFDRFNKQDALKAWDEFHKNE